MKIVVVGKNSQIGKHLSLLSKKNSNDMFFFDSNSLNLLNFENIKNILYEIQPSLVINFAAFTDVDSAEDNQDLVYKVNALGPKNLAQISSEINAFLIHISTDYVFGENSEGPFSSNAKTGPVNFYGMSKLDGEDGVLNNNKRSLVIRTSGIFSSYNKNFVKTVINKLHNNENLNVISDQKISITYAGDIAEFIDKISSANILSKLITEPSKRIIHFTNIGYTNWYEVAEFIEISLREKINFLGSVSSIKSEKWSAKAQRGSDTRLNIDYSLFDSLDIKLINWQDRVKKVIEKSYRGRNG